MVFLRTRIALRQSVALPVAIARRAGTSRGRSCACCALINQVLSYDTAIDMTVSVSWTRQQDQKSMFFVLLLILNCEMNFLCLSHTIPASAQSFRFKDSAIRVRPHLFRMPGAALIAPYGLAAEWDPNILLPMGRRSSSRHQIHYMKQNSCCIFIGSKVGNPYLFNPWALFIESLCQGDRITYFLVEIRS